MKKIIYTRPDGGICVVHPVYKKDGELEVEMSVVLEKSVPPDATNVQVVEESEIPTDRSFRNAWTPSGASIVVDMTKARAIHLSRIRRIRDKKLELLDKETMKNIKNPTKIDEIESQKQTLRDLPQTIASELSSASTPEELRLVQKDFLENKS